MPSCWRTRAISEREGEFRKLLEILDHELRLLTPAEEPDAAPVASAEHPAAVETETETTALRPRGTHRGPFTS